MGWGREEWGIGHWTSRSTASLDWNPLADVMSYAQEEKVAIRAKGRATIRCVHPVAVFPLYDWGSRPKNRGMTWPEWSRERLIVSFAGFVDQPC